MLDIIMAYRRVILGGNEVSVGKCCLVRLNLETFFV